MATGGQRKNERKVVTALPALATVYVDVPDEEAEGVTGRVTAWVSSCRFTSAPADAGPHK